MLSFSPYRTLSLYGTPGKIDEIRRIADEHGALIVEDAAESLGATYKGVQTGTFGDLAAISFNGNKIITGSSGGMLLIGSKEDADKARKWSTQSREAAPWYQHEELGYNYRMSNIIAGIVRGQIPYLNEHIAQKKAIWERYKAGLADLPVYINEHPEFELVDTYVDSGYSGTSFERPDFQRLMDDIRHGRIQCIIVKDLSRFGRNYIEAGYYIETILPQLNVRLIAINDRFDSSREEDLQGIRLPIKNMVNSLYARDLSKKFCKTYDMRFQTGTNKIREGLYGFRCAGRYSR